MVDCLPGVKLETRIGCNLDRIKGALIVIVAADHNDCFRQLAPSLFEPLTFHVLGFFLLAFTFGVKNWTVRFVADRVARYLVPYWWTLTAATLAFFLIFRGGAGINDTLVGWAMAALIGNAPFTKSSAGLLMLWFLPSLFGLSCLLALFNSLQSRLAKRFAVGFAIAAHLLIPLLPHSSLLWLPFGAAIAVEVFVLGLIWQQLLHSRLPRLWGPAVSVVFCVSYYALVSVPVHLEIATLELVGIENPWIMILQDISGMTGVLTVVWLVGFPLKMEWLERIGKNSLLIYLFHPVVYVALGKIWLFSSKAESGMLMLFVVGCLTTILAIGSAYVFSVIVVRSRFLSTWITPKSWEQWPPSKLLATARTT